MVPDRVDDETFWKNYHTHMWEIQADVGHLARQTAEEGERNKAGRQVI